MSWLVLVFALEAGILPMKGIRLPAVRSVNVGYGLAALRANNRGSVR